MNFVKNILTIFMLGQMWLCASDFSIWYIPFEAKTDRPITRTILNKSPNIFINITTAISTDQISRLITAGNEPMNEQHLRLKLVLDRKTYFFDTHGNGVMTGGNQVKIDRDSFEKLVSNQKICFEFGESIQ